MKLYVYALLLLSSTLAFADDRAVTISLRDSGDAVKSADINAIQQVVGQAISAGIIDTMLTYRPNQMAKNRFFACAEANATASQEQFTTLVNNLHRVNPNSTARYQLKTTAKCGKNDAIACMANPLSCFSSRFISSGAYSDYVAKAQVAAGLAEISVGKIMMEAKLSEGIDVTSPIDVGLQFVTKNCSVIAVTGQATDGIATIQCVLTGNALIMGKTLTWTRFWNPDLIGYQWVCTTDVETKYAGKCKG